MESAIKVQNLGLMPYGEALLHQERCHTDVVEGGRPVILTVEHPSVLTLGKNAHSGNLLFGREFYRSLGVDVFETDRGGEVTAHMPGQLVVYPIIPVLSLGYSAKSYIALLEDSVIEVLAGYGLKAQCDAQFPGVWIEDRKICAIGVRIKQRVSMHGLALNVCNPLDLFSKIVPCGIQTRSVTSMTEELGKKIDLNEVRTDLVQTILNKASLFCGRNLSETPN
jgi:lipoate-protein ligase B